MSSVMQDLVTSFETGAATHPGKVRKQNEDDLLVQPEIGVWAIADGMGGHVAGALASATVVKSLASIGRPASAPDLLARLEDRVMRANTHLRNLAREQGDVVIGATLAVLLAYEDAYACVWSGDSRVYSVRNGAITQLSRDHTEVQELIDSGLLNRQQARDWPRQNVVTRALGVDDEPELELSNGTLRAGDAYVICSDGLTAHVEDQEILGCVMARPAQAACDSLIAMTLERGGTDNVTVIIVRVKQEPGPAGLRPPTGDLPLEDHAP